jgi:hypothetical protein
MRRVLGIAIAFLAPAVAQAQPDKNPTSARLKAHFDSVPAIDTRPIFVDDSGQRRQWHNKSELRFQVRNQLLVIRD